MTTLIPPAELALAKREAQQVTPLAIQAEELAVVDRNSYALADQILGKITSIRSSITDRLAKILNPLNEARNSALALRRELDGPPAIAETMIRQKMKQFKLQEAEAERVEAERIRREQEAIEKAAEEARRKEEAAKTIQMRNKLAEKRIALETEAAIKSLEKPADSVRVAGSTSRKVMRIEVVNYEYVLQSSAMREALLQDDDMKKCISTIINRLYKLAPAVVRGYPGIKEYEDVSIIKR